MSFIDFREEMSKGKTRVWLVMNKKTEVPLGIIKWNTGWRRYVFEGYMDIYFDAACLEELAAFLRRAVNADYANVSEAKKMKRRFRCDWCERLLERDELAGRTIENKPVCIECVASDDEDESEDNCVGETGACELHVRQIEKEHQKSGSK